MLFPVHMYICCDGHVQQLSQSLLYNSLQPRHHRMVVALKTQLTDVITSLPVKKLSSRGVENNVELALAWISS